MFFFTDCDCHPEGADGPNCSLHGICSCKEHVVGDKCDECESTLGNHPKCDECDTGFYGYPDCKPCTCNEEGSQNLDCDKTTGFCQCKENVTGDHCTECTDGFGGFPNCTSNQRDIQFDC